MSLVAGYICPGCGLDTPRRACADCDGLLTWDRPNGFRCEACGRIPTSLVCSACGRDCLQHRRPGEQCTPAPGDDASPSVIRSAGRRTVEPLPVAAAGSRMESAPVRSREWPLFVGLAVVVHAVLAVPLVAGVAGPDTVVSDGRTPPAVTSITILDTSELPQPLAPDRPTPSTIASPAPAPPPLDSAAADDHARRAQPEPVTLTIGPDMPEPDGVDTSPRRASLSTKAAPLVGDPERDATTRDQPQAGAVASASPAVADREDGQGATLVPVDLMPIPTPPPQPPDPPVEAKVYGVVEPPKPAAAAPLPFRRALPPAEGRQDPDAAFDPALDAAYVPPPTLPQQPKATIQGRTVAPAKGRFRSEAINGDGGGASSGGGGNGR